LGTDPIKLEHKISWFENQKAFEDSHLQGIYLGKAAVIFNGSKNEKVGSNGKLDLSDAKAADVTIYGPGNESDIKTYTGLTMTSDPKQATVLNEGMYDARQEQMQTSPYGKDAITYRLSQNGSDVLKGIFDGKEKKMTGVFFHRTNWDGKAGGKDKSGNTVMVSSGCPVIDGRQWKAVEKQLNGIRSFKLIINR